MSCPQAYTYLRAFVGSVPASYVADLFSRRTSRGYLRCDGPARADTASVMVAGIIFCVGGILQTATNGKEMMMAGRFIGGIGIGQMVSLAPSNPHQPTLTGF